MWNSKCHGDGRCRSRAADNNFSNSKVATARSKIRDESKLHPPNLNKSEVPFLKPSNVGKGFVCNVTSYCASPPCHSFLHPRHYAYYMRKRRRRSIFLTSQIRTGKV